MYLLEVSFYLFVSYLFDDFVCEHSIPISFARLSELTLSL